MAARTNSGKRSLFVGGVSALLASACCLGPLALVSLGVSGAWIGNLRALEPYRPLFILGALAAVFLSYRRIFRPTAECAPGEVCAVPLVRTGYKVLFGIVVVLVAIAALFPYVLPLFY